MTSKLSAVLWTQTPCKNKDICRLKRDFWWFLQVQEFFGSSSPLQTTVVQVLWERFTGKRETSGLNRRAAVLLLGMAAR